MSWHGANFYLTHTISIESPSYCTSLGLGTRLELAATLLPLMALEAIKYDETGLLVLNQLLLPGETHYEEIKSVEDAWDAIKTMKVEH